MDGMVRRNGDAKIIAFALDMTPEFGHWVAKLASESVVAVSRSFGDSGLAAIGSTGLGWRRWSSPKVQDISKPDCIVALSQIIHLAPTFILVRAPTSRPLALATDINCTVSYLVILVIPSTLSSSEAFMISRLLLALLRRRTRCRR
jgi:hypothetical protein